MLRIDQKKIEIKKTGEHLQCRTLHHNILNEKKNAKNYMFE